MRRIFTMTLAAISAVALVTASLWAWQGSADWASDWQPTNPPVITWAVRSLALAAALLAQFLALRFVLGGLYRRRAFDDLLSLASGVACAIAVVSGAALAMAGR